jgi:hypothetical protein
MISLEQAQRLSMAELANLSALDLMRIQEEAEDAFRAAKNCKAWIEGAIELKYEEQAQTLRQQIGKDTGTVHFDDNGIRITADLPKKPVWDQTQLAEISERIRIGGDNPHEFIDITYKVPERKYTAWPDHLRKAFEPARTLKTGKPIFRLSISGETAA